MLRQYLVQVVVYHLTYKSHFSIITLAHHTSKGCFFEDDGESYAYQNGVGLWINWQLVSTNDRIDLRLKANGSYIPAWQELVITLPKGELRTLYINDEPINKVNLSAIS
ncbi:DUF5110 domain-containing protein [Gilliamella sp. B2838]|uniref:DUF5110 domain-containing protein n=1 Tax=Gilliamella sp. B2838 TaxID=2818020 RepID=UPI00226A4D84|nr:DUF5110 domain-containing protein [Gilliamella sp. B2838]